jgi:hypothetical protein
MIIRCLASIKNCYKFNNQLFIKYLQMKKLILSFFALAMTIANTYAVEDSISTTPGYSMDVYYSMQNGVVKSEARTNWDIAFSTYKMSSSILINGGSGVELYTYPNGDTADWATVDTAGISTWPIMNNSEESWEEGAFGANALGHPDYGWGIYNMVTHNLTGDSLFIIKTKDGSFMKLWIMGKESMAGIYHFRFASIDGSSDTTINLDSSPYSTKNFIYYDLGNKQILDREPASDTWDILFTKYMAAQPNGGFYSVTGVLSNIGTKVSKHSNVDTSTIDWPATMLSDNISTIGWDWKTFSMSTFSYVVADSLVYFVENANGDIYKMIFTGFDGSSTGNVYFTKQLLSLTAISQYTDNIEVTVFPNPATDFIRVSIAADNVDANINIYNVAGKLVKTLSTNSQLTNISVSELPKGLYFVNIQNDKTNLVNKIIVQ